MSFTFGAPGGSNTRTDEEQLQKKEDCTDLLLAAGYFRARIKNLDPFDVIVGGLVWCISTCNYSVDVDLLYSENSSIGQKIALTEKIVEVIALLGCPHSVEPHQIQGLDFINVFPVVQWLVRKTLECKQEHGDELENFASFQFQQNANQGPSESALSKRVESLSSSIAPVKKYCRGPNFNAQSITDDALCTVVEYSGSLSSVPSTSSTAPLSTLVEVDYNEKITLANSERIAEGFQEISGGPSTQKGSKLDQMKKQLQAKKEQLRQLEDEKNEQSKAAVELNNELAQATEKLAQTRAIVDKADPAVVEQIRTLLSEFDSQREREKEYKAACNENLSRLHEEIALFERHSNQDDDSLLSDIREQLSSANAELDSARVDNAKVAQQVALLQRQLDTVPSQIEIAQYQQRFIELYSQMSSKLRETKQYVSLHNTLLDVRDYHKKEIALLTNIEDVLPNATQDAFRDSFVQNLQAILRPLETSLDKMLKKVETAESAKKEVTSEFVRLKEMERLFHATVEKFRKACEENESLRSKLTEAN